VLVGLRPPTHGLVSTTTFSIALALFVAVVACGYQAWAIRGWRRDPQPQRLWEHYRSWPDAWLRQQLVLNWIESYAANRERLRAKVQYIRLTQVLLGVETVYLVALTIARPYL